MSYAQLSNEGPPPGISPSRPPQEVSEHSAQDGFASKNRYPQSSMASGSSGRGGGRYSSASRVPVITDPRKLPKLAHMNAEVNKMTKDDITRKLQSLRLSTEGNKEKVKKRLKLQMKKQRAMQLARIPRQPHVHDRHADYLCVLDFECTCEDGIYDYPHEIIEFPVILLKTSTLEIVDEFHAFCKPQLNPVLTEFASKLTGISQEQVDEARPFLDVLDDFRSWLDSHKLGTEHRYNIVTDGPWDMAKFFQMQCLLSGLPSVPHEFRYYINLRRSFTNMYNQGQARGQKSSEWKNLQGMLDVFQMTFEGRAHSGIDDARNIARIAIRMMSDGCELRINERLLRRDRAETLNAKRTKRMEERDRLREEERKAQREKEEEERRKAAQGSPEKTEEQKALDKAIAERIERENHERQVWRDHLPYKVVSVSKQEYNMDMHEECETCSEPDSENDVI